MSFIAFSNTKEESIRHAQSSHVKFAMRRARQQKY
jgi:hypothetical protein